MAVHQILVLNNKNVNLPLFEKMPLLEVVILIKNSSVSAADPVSVKGQFTQITNKRKKEDTVF